MAEGCPAKLCEYRPSLVKSSAVESSFGTPVRTYDPSPPGGSCVGRAGVMFFAAVDPPSLDPPHPAPTVTSTAARITPRSSRLVRTPITLSGRRHRLQVS